MLFAEPGHPYDEADHPLDFAWRRGYWELMYHRVTKSITLRRGPKYSVYGHRCCQMCRGNGYLSADKRPSGVASDRAVPCPTCPALRIFFEHLPVWPARTLDNLRQRLINRNRPPAPRSVWDEAEENTPQACAEEPPF